MLIVFKSIFRVPHLDMAKLSHLKSLGRFSGSKPKDLITKSAFNLNSAPSLMTGFFLPDESGDPSSILLTSIDSTLEFL